ncbi:Ribosome biogenesis regulatory protein-like protein [Diplonema papillatum]|nr:Ribosome biogenesis regulatory protein-like protein [Diplonema papillatum]
MTAVVGPPVPEGCVLDLGNLLIADQTQPKGFSEDVLEAKATQCMQGLIAHLFHMPTVKHEDGRLASVPTPTTPMPREKPPPKEQELTKWEEFRKEKGIKKRKKEGRVFDEEKGEWLATYGSKRRQIERKHDWLREVSDNYVPKEEGGDPFLDDQIEKRERVRKQKSRQDANQRRLRENSTMDAVHSTATKLATASMGKYDAGPATSKKGIVGKGKAPKKAVKKSKTAQRKRK